MYLVFTWKCDYLFCIFSLYSKCNKFGTIFIFFKCPSSDLDSVCVAVDQTFSVPTPEIRGLIDVIGNFYLLLTLKNKLFKRQKIKRGSEWLIFYKNTNICICKILVNPGLYIKVDSTYDWTLITFCTVKLSTLWGFTKGVSVDVSYL